jgi:hypothetical protein
VPLLKKGRQGFSRVPYSSLLHGHAPGMLI